MSEDTAALYVSNATCYYGEGQVSDPRYIPCGNAYLSGVQHCCYEGDDCLSSYACYDASTGVVYLAGCTDPTFLDEQCAQKPGYSGQQWVAMARCSGANVSLWTGCAHHASVTTLQKEDCSCNTSNVLIDNTNGQSSLYRLASLPATAGGTISFNPTALPTVAATTTGNSSAGSSGTITAVAGGSARLSGGAKAGIIVGSVVGGLLVLGLLAFAVRRVHKSKVDRAVAEAVAEAEAVPSEPGRSLSPQSQPASQLSPPTSRYVSPETVEKVNEQEEGKIAGLGYKPELSADPFYKSELPAADTSHVRPQELAAWAEPKH